MRIVFLAASAALFLASPAAHAGCTTTGFGNTAYTNCSDGSSFTSQTYGNTTYHSGSGLSGTSQNFGNTTFHNFGGLSGTSQQFGNTGFHNFGNFSGTTQDFGDTTFGNGDLFGDW